jgi:hypothetical protein
MNAEDVPETKASRAFRLLFEKRGEERGEAQGQVNGWRDALLRVLAARGLSPTTEERELIATLTDIAGLDRCVRAAVTAASVAAVLACAVRGAALGEAHGRREALLCVLAARGLSPTKEERASIAALTDAAALDCCVKAAVTAPSVAAVLASAGASHRPRAAPARTSRRRAIKTPSSRP